MPASESLPAKIRLPKPDWPEWAGIDDQAVAHYTAEECLFRTTVWMVADSQRSAPRLDQILPVVAEIVRVVPFLGLGFRRT